jgi:hypothetical protein
VSARHDRLGHPENLDLLQTRHLMFCSQSIWPCFKSMERRLRRRSLLTLKSVSVLREANPLPRKIMGEQIQVKSVEVVRNERDAMMVQNMLGLLLIRSEDFRVFWASPCIKSSRFSRIQRMLSVSREP